jgi:hypothetical protein
MHYIKSTHFRVIHVDGALGGRSPRGQLHISVFSERSPLPQVVTHRLNGDGTLGEILRVEGKQNVVREVEADLVMDLETAQKLSEWLQKRLEEAST